MQNPRHNDAYSHYTDVELIRHVRSFFPNEEGETKKNLLRITLVQRMMLDALVGRLEARLGDAER